VSLLKAGYDWNGNRTLMPVATSITDDRGEYRLFWVSPGRYYLSAGAPDIPVMFFNRGINMVQGRSYLRTYYPGTLESARATILEILPGAELNAIDIDVPSIPTYRVKGTIMDAATGKPPRYADVSLIPRGGNSLENNISTGGPGTPPYVNGTFELTNVVPGSYLLHVTSEPDFDAPLPTDAVASARTASDLLGVAFNRGPSAEIPVDVNASDVTDVKVLLHPGVRVSLRVTLEGKALSTISDVEKLRFGLWHRQASLVDSAVVQQGALSADGATAIENVADGEYRISMDQRVPNIYIKEATIDNTNVLDAFWTLSGAPKGVLRVVLGDNPGRVDGTLTDAASKPVAGAEVVLVPDKSRFRNELFRTADTDEKGQFAFRNIVPGDYRVFAWEALESNAYYDPEILTEYQQQGKPVRVTEGSQQAVDVRIIPAAAP
jgi:hypothetical protein